jgi:radical SAM protein with 4Fe4S-binding SPASM domain
MKLFEYSFISNYSNNPLEYYRDYFHNPQVKAGGQDLDNRIEHYGEKSTNPCQIMFDNFLIANDGEVYICCHDWRNEVKIGNLLDSSLEELDVKRWEYAKQICGKQMTDKAHDTCIRCNQKWPVSGFDINIRNKALQEIALLV